MMCICNPRLGKQRLEGPGACWPARLPHLVNSQRPSLRKQIESWGGGSEVKNTSCSCRGTRFSSQHPNDGSQLPVTPMLGALTISSFFRGDQKCMRCLYMWRQTLMYMKIINTSFYKCTCNPRNDSQGHPSSGVHTNTHAHIHTYAWLPAHICIYS